MRYRAPSIIECSFSTHVADVCITCLVSRCYWIPRFSLPARAPFMFRFHGFPDTLPLHKVEVCNRIRCVALQLFLITCIGESNLQPEGVVEGWVQHGLMSLAELSNSEHWSSQNLHSCGGYVVSLPDVLYFEAAISSLYGIAENFLFPFYSIKLVNSKGSKT